MKLWTLSLLVALAWIVLQGAVDELLDRPRYDEGEAAA